MKRHAQCLWRSLAMIPLLGLYNFTNCQANVIRDVADDLNQRADDLDGQDEDIDLGDYLSDLVEDL
ncbi:MAG: hypothetical protein ACYSUI_08685 [Planctomycetota bacterium]